MCSYPLFYTLYIIMLKNVQRGSILFRIVQRGSISLILREKPCKGTKKNWNLKENKEKMHFFSKIFGHVKKKAVPLHPLSREKACGM